MTNYDFPFTGIIKRFTGSSFEEKGTCICDVQPVEHARELLKDMVSSYFFPLYDIFVPPEVDIKFGDRIVINGDEYIIKRKDPRTQDAVIGHNELRAAKNTLLTEEYQCTARRVEKRGDGNKDSVTGEYYGESDEISVKQFIINKERIMNKEDYSGIIDQGLIENVDYLVFAECGNEIEINDILEVDDEKYNVKFKFESAYKIWTMGFESLKNKNL